MLSVAASSAASVIVSAPEPPTMLSTFEIVTTLAAELSVTLSVPAPRSTEPFESKRRDRDGVVPEPPMIVSTFVTVAGVGEVAERQRCRCRRRGRCTFEDTMAAPKVSVSAAVPPTSVSMLRDRRHVGEVAEGQLVGAGVEIDRGVRQEAPRP